jgi:hypothetical protein
MPTTADRKEKVRTAFNGASPLGVLDPDAILSKALQADLYPTAARLTRVLKQKSATRVLLRASIIAVLREPTERHGSISYVYRPVTLLEVISSIMDGKNPLKTRLSTSSVSRAEESTDLPGIQCKPSQQKPTIDQTSKVPTRELTLHLIDVIGAFDDVSYKCSLHACASKSPSHTHDSDQGSAALSGFST